MILADTSVWIDLLKSGSTLAVPIDILMEIVTCGPVVQELFQGMRSSPDARAFLLAFDAVPRICNPLPESVFRDAAEIYRQGRSRGGTIRSSTACLIAAIAIKYDVPVWHRDRDYRAIAQFTPLQTLERS